MMYNLTVERPYEHLLKVFQDISSGIGLVEGHPILIRKAIAQDALLLNVREEQKDTFGGMSLDKAVRMHAWLEILSPMNYTVFHDDKMLLLVSIIPVSEGVAEISFLTDVNFVEASRKIKIAMIRLFKQTVEVLPFRRLQAKVKEGFDIGTRFVESMGLTSEGILKGYGPDGDNYIMYGKIR